MSMSGSWFVYEMRSTIVEENKGGVFAYSFSIRTEAVRPQRSCLARGLIVSSVVMYLPVSGCLRTIHGVSTPSVGVPQGCTTE